MSISNNTAHGNAARFNPASRMAITVSETPYRKTAAGRELIARVYQPEGNGPFPVLLDLHGGAWNQKNRFANEPMDRALATSGLLVVAIDMTLAAEAPYPASVQDASYGLRWLKLNAKRWQGDAATIGVFGSSTGGHIAELLGMRPRDPRYNALALAEAPDIDASLDYIAARSPISDPYARFMHAQKRNREAMMQNTRNWFKPWESVFEANPQQILDRGEQVALPPLLIMQGGLDDNVLPAMQGKFVNAYRAAGGSVDFTVFEDCDHEWVATPGPQTDRAHDMVRQFIARHVNAKLAS